MHLREANFGLDMNQLTHQPDNEEEELQQKIQALITIKTKVEDLVDKNIKVSDTSLQSYSSVPRIRKQWDIIFDIFNYMQYINGAHRWSKKRDTMPNTIPKPT